MYNFLAQYCHGPYNLTSFSFILFLTDTYECVYIDDYKYVQ